MSPAERANEFAYRKQLFEAKFINRGAGHCWPWTAGKMTSGIGQMGMGKLFDGKPVSANVASWFFYRDSQFDFGGDYKVIHLCKSVDCVNPSHLSAVPTKGGLGLFHAMHVLDFLKDQCPSAAGHLDEARVAMLRAYKEQRST